MSREKTHRCPVCERAFSRPEDLWQHQQAKGHQGASRASRDARSRKGTAWKAAGVLIAVAAVGVALLRDRPSLPSVGSHWHADYAIEICGRTLRRQPPSPGDVHTHGDGRIHVHPASRITAGRAANLAAFFYSLGGRLSDSLLELPGAGMHRNGELCRAGLPGSVRVYVNAQEIRRPARYVPQDGDDILITFGPPSAAREREPRP